MSIPVHHIFVTGGEPTVTYVSRPEQGLEEEVQQYLTVANRVLAVSGPSKSGKSTLVNRVLRQGQRPHIRVTGASLSSMQDFWQILAHRASIPSVVETTTERTDELSVQIGGKIGGGAIIPAEISSQFGARLAERGATVNSSTVALSESVKDALVSLGICLVVDDFHYAPDDVRRSMAREIKDLVFNGARVILVAIPERVMDVLQNEGELAGRIKRLQVRAWGDLELLLIATQGFDALNLHDPSRGGLAAALVQQSYGSPLLMQALCEQLCTENGVRESSDLPVDLRSPHWPAFFSQMARDVQPSVIEHLNLGPVQRRRRKQKDVIGGGSVDLYSAVLLAVNRLLPQRRMTPGELSDAMNGFLTARPQLEDVRRALRQMASIATANRGAGDVALDYSTSPERLTIVDPYLAFFTKWGLEALGLPVGTV